MGSRFIITGRNDAFPKTVSMPMGVGVDGAVFTRRMAIKATESKCTTCEGWGSITVAASTPWSVGRSAPCPDCAGDGIVSEVAA